MLAKIGSVKNLITGRTHTKLLAGVVQYDYFWKSNKLLFTKSVNDALFKATHTIAQPFHWNKENTVLKMYFENTLNDNQRINSST